MNLDDTRAAAQKFFNFFKMFADINEFVESVNQLDTLKRESDRILEQTKQESEGLRAQILLDQETLSLLKGGLDEERQRAQTDAEGIKAAAVKAANKITQDAADKIDAEKMKHAAALDQARVNSNKEIKGLRGELATVVAEIQGKRATLNGVNQAVAVAEAKLKDVQDKLSALKAAL